MTFANWQCGKHWHFRIFWSKVVRIGRIAPESKLPNGNEVGLASSYSTSQQSFARLDFTLREMSFSAAAFDAAMKRMLDQFPESSDLSMFSEMQQSRLKDMRRRVIAAFSNIWKPLTEFPEILFEFYLLPLIVDILADEFEDFDETKYRTDIESQKKRRELTWNDVTMLIWLIHFVTDESLSDAPKRKPLTHYSHILVDEAQYYDPRILRLLRELTIHAAREGVLTIVGDVEQRVATDGGIATWDDLEIELTEKQIRRLPTNHRWAREIFDFIEKMHDVLEITEPLKRPRQWRVVGGQRPEIFRAKTLDAVVQFAVERIVELRDHATTRIWRIAVVIPHTLADQRMTVVKGLEAAGIAARVASGEDVNNSIDKVIVTGFDDIVGLEFDAVFILALNYPAVHELHKDDRGDLWVAATRTRRFLFIGVLDDDELFLDDTFGEYVISQ